MSEPLSLVITALSLTEPFWRNNETVTGDTQEHLRRHTKAGHYNTVSSKDITYTIVSLSALFREGE
jgi:hypothetical protein